MALNSSNSNAGSNTPKVEAGALPNFNTEKTESKSNGNFSGGDINFDASKLSINNPFDTKEPQQPTFNTDDVFKPTVSGNLDIDLPKTNNNNSNNSNTTYSNNSNEPTMTVDEVYGKSSNQPVVEKQGDYSVSSNEKSNVETSTFGKQDEISVTPTSVTENKGVVGNDAIQSVEGLDFQQKDKASQEVLDSKKDRDDAEAEDKADKIRNKLKNNLFDAKQQEGGEDVQIGDRNEDAAAAKPKVDEAEKEYLKKRNDLLLEKKSIELTRTAALDDIRWLKDQHPNKYGGGYIIDEGLGNQARSAVRELAYRNELMDIAHKYGIDTSSLKPDNSNQDIEWLINDFFKDKDKEIDSELKNLDEKYLEPEATPEPESQPTTEPTTEPEPEATPEPESQPTTEPTTEPEPETTSTSESKSQSGAETSYKDAMDAIKNSTNATPEQKAQAEEALTNLENSRQELEEAAAKARSGNPADLVAYQEALKEHNKRLKEAQKIGNRWTQTDFNKDYTRAIMDSKDFKVTLSDGTEMDFSDFMTEEVEKSPQYAKAMYDAKAQEYEDKAANATGINKVYYKIKAKIERMKSEWSQTTLGSNFTFADDQVRNQFYQFADTNMRATYATNNNILNDPNATPEDKAEAFKDIEQAKSLKAAAEALKASTGVLSGAGDDTSDGTFGTTDVGSLTDDQRMMASIKMFTQAALGLGVSPAANEAYQSYYYLNRGDESVFENDLDNDGFTWVEEYGNNAAAGLILSAGELATGVVLLFNPASFANGVDLILDAAANANNSIYGVRNDVDKLESMNNEILEHFKEAEQTNGLPEEAHEVITNAITQIENFELKSDEVGNLDNWLEGSGSNTASNEKFNQALKYDEWMKLIEADPVMKEYAKSLAEKKKKEENAKKDNADAGVNS